MKKPFVSLAKVLLLVAGIGFVVCGIVFGDCNSLYMKAIFVCMECAGIG